MKITEYDEIYLIVMDTVSAESTPFASNFENMPFLSNMGNRGFLAKNCYSNSPWTLPSHASIFSGLDPKEHGVSTKNKIFDQKSFVEVLSEQGFETHGFSANPLISNELGFGKGFKNLINGENLKFAANNVSYLENKDFSNRNKYLVTLKELMKNLSFSSAKGLFNLFKNKFSTHDLKSEYIIDLVNKNRSNNSKQFFYLNLMDAHAPYNVPNQLLDTGKYTGDIREKVSEEFLTEGFRWTKDFDKFKASEVQKLYRDSIRYLDKVIKSIYDSVEQRDRKQLFIVTSDHGEMIKHDDTDIWAHQLEFGRERSMFLSYLW